MPKGDDEAEVDPLIGKLALACSAAKPRPSQAQGGGRGPLVPVPSQEALAGPGVPGALARAEGSHARPPDHRRGVQEEDAACDGRRRRPERGALGRVDMAAFGSAWDQATHRTGRAPFKWAARGGACQTAALAASPLRPRHQAASASASAAHTLLRCASQVLKFEDLVQLPDPNDMSMLHVLRARYEKDSIFTWIGPVLLALNPYKAVDICSS
eukprot:1697175-Prymnesium_polylepis.1